MKSKTGARTPSLHTDPLSDTPLSDTPALAADDDNGTPGTGALASELRRQRKTKGMSLDDLAEASGVSRAMISKIERGQSSPSTSTLSKLVDALETTVSRLLGQESKPHDVVLIRHDQQTTLTDPDTGFSRRVLSPILPGRGLDFVMAELPAKSDTGALVAHTLPVEEYIYVLSGTLIVTVGDTRTVLGASDALYYRADLPHRFENDGRAACKYLIVINPIRN